MKKICIIIVVAFCLLILNGKTTFAEETIQITTIENDFALDRVVVVLKKNDYRIKEYYQSDFPELDCKSIKKLNPYKEQHQFEKISEQLSRSPLTEVSNEEFHAILSIELSEPGKKSVMNAIKSLKGRSDVIYVGPDYCLSLSKSSDDPYYTTGKQWAIDKIGLPAAWNYSTGTVSTVKVGVIDTGIDGTHPELSSKISSTLNRDFTSGSEVVVSTPTDPNGHGTHVAGIIGAATNNTVGISGVCWNVELVSLRTFGSNGRGYSSHTVMAIDYADRVGIKILNFSASSNNILSLIYDFGMESSISNYSGLMICSAGNDGNNIDEFQFDTNSYPASLALSNIISVGSSTSTDTRASDSNYGAVSVDLFAPGDSILSLYPTSKCADPSHAGVCEAPGYHYMSGTSMAAPYVTGVAALLLSRDSSLTPARIKSVILDNVTPVSAFSTLCVSGGRLNAYAALHYLFHAHDYTSSYSQYDDTRHIARCWCGKTKLENHAVQTNVSGTSICVNCGAETSIGFIPIMKIEKPQEND